jgi:hypothetical protein
MRVVDLASVRMTVYPIHLYKCVLNLFSYYMLYKLSGCDDIKMHL